METIRLFIVDDHKLVRDGMKAILSGIKNIEITGEATDGKELFELLRDRQPDVIIMDISLPEISGIELTRMLTQQYPEIRVLVLSMYNDEEFIFNSIKAGAKGFLPKNTSREELVEAINAIYQGEEFFGESISKIILRSYVRKATENHEPADKGRETLSPREIEILRLFVEGHINKEISEMLDISIRTVETHKNHIMKKLALRSTVEMVKYAIRNKIVDIK
jgi:DNA-binding NarL/FixJ family response regulator